MRRVEHSQRAADPVQVVDESEISVTDGQVIETHRPPADWSERVKSAQPPAHWQAKVQRSRSDSAAIAQPIDPDAPDDSTLAVDQVEDQLSEDSAPVVPSSTRSITHPDVPVKQPGRVTSKTTDQIASDVPAPSNAEFDLSQQQTDVIPRETDRRVAPQTKPSAARSLRKIEIPAVEQQPTKSDSPLESETRWREAETTSQNEQQPTATSRIKHEAHTSLHADEDQTSIERRVIETRDLTKPDQSRPEPKPSFAESLPDRRVSPKATDSPHHAASMQEWLASVDLTYPPESPVDRDTLASPSPRPNVEVNDQFTTNWPVSKTVRSAQTWATITDVKPVEHESSAFDQRWPSLPDEPSATDEDFEIVLRERERLRRLDLEQRGLAWNA